MWFDIHYLLLLSSDIFLFIDSCIINNCYIACPLFAFEWTDNSKNTYIFCMFPISKLKGNPKSDGQHHLTLIWTWHSVVDGHWSRLPMTGVTWRGCDVRRWRADVCRVASVWRCVWQWPARVLCVIVSPCNGETYYNVLCIHVTRVVHVRPWLNAFWSLITYHLTQIRSTSKRQNVNRIRVLYNRLLGCSGQPFVPVGQ